MATQDDAKVVQRFREGDRQAFDDLYSHHAPSLLGFLAARVNDQQLAEDLSQMVWVRVWENRDTFDGTHFRGWLFQIARNALSDEGRSIQRRSRTASLDDTSEPGRQSDPSEALLRQDELRALKDCIKSVGGDFVEAVVRRHLNDETAEELAASHGITRAAVDSRVFRGKQLLRDCLEKKLK